MKHRITAGLLALFVSLSILILPSWPANADPIDRTQTVTLAALSAETDFQFELNLSRLTTFDLIKTSSGGATYSYL